MSVGVVYVWKDVCVEVVCVVPVSDIYVCNVSVYVPVCMRSSRHLIGCGVS